MQTRKLLAAAPLLLLLTACPGEDDPNPPSGNDGGVTETPDSGTPDSGTFNPGPANVQGSGQWHFIEPAAGPSVSPRYLEGTTIAALIPDAAGTTYTVKPATLAPTGEMFSIENVTAPYLLRFGTTYSWFTGRTSGTFTPDLSYPVFSRFAVVEPIGGTNLVLNVTGLAPWQADLDDVQLSAPFAGLRYFSLLDCPKSISVPSPGTTSLNQTFDWTIDPSANCANDTYLIDASLRDTVYVTQLVGRRASNAQLLIKELKRAYSTASFSLTNGQSTTLDAALTVPATTSRSFDVRFGAFRAAALQSHPNAAMSALGFGVGTLPGWSTFGESTGYPDLAVVSSKDLTVADQTVSLEYANPFPAEWGTFLSLRANTTTDMSVPLPSGGEAPALKVRGGVSLSIPVAASQSGAPVIQPLVGPARSLMVNGQSATGAPLTGIGTTPLVSWQAPELGNPDFYRVSVYELRVSASTGRTTATFVSDFFTESTSLRIPADILASGKHYYLRVLATKSSRWSPDKPFLTQFGEGTAISLSSRLSP